MPRVTRGGRQAQSYEMNNPAAVTNPSFNHLSLGTSWSADDVNVEGRSPHGRSPPTPLRRVTSSQSMSKLSYIQQPDQDEYKSGLDTAHRSQHRTGVLSNEAVHPVGKPPSALVRSRTPQITQNSERSKSNTVIWDKETKKQQQQKKEDKKKHDGRTTNDLLLDYLVNLNQEETDKGKTAAMIFEEGFGGRKGYEDNDDYWKCRVQSESIPKREQDSDGTAAACMHGPDAEVMEEVKVLRTPDNTVFNHVNPRCRQFFELGGYRAFPEVVTISVDLRQLINVAETRFRVNVHVTLRWYDAFYDNHDFFDQSEFHSTRVPYVTFDGVAFEDCPVNLPASAAGLSQEEKHSGVVHRKDSDPPGVVYKIIELDATFFANMDLRNYPRDEQRLPIHVRLWGANVPDDADCGRILLPLSGMVNRRKSQAPPWEVLPITMCLCPKRRHEKQDLKVTISVLRVGEHLYFENTIILLLFVLTSLSFFAFAVPADDERAGGGGFTEGFEARCQITLTLMLVAVNFKFEVERQMPQIKLKYWTPVDYYVYFCFGCMAFIVFANSLVMILEQHQDDSDVRYPRLDLTSHTKGVIDQLVNQTGLGGDGGGENDASSDDVVLAQFMDAVLCYFGVVMFALGNVWIRVSMLRRKDKKYDKALGHVGRPSDDEVLSTKAKKLSGEKMSHKRPVSGNNGAANVDTIGQTRYEGLTPREKSFLRVTDANDAARKTLKASIVRYQDDRSTLRKRREHTAEEYRSKEEVRPKHLKQCHCQACDGRREYSGPSEDIVTLCLEAGIEEQRAGAMGKKFDAHGITFRLLKAIFDANAGTIAVQRMLESVEIGLEDSAKIMAALSPSGNKFPTHIDSDHDITTVICLQSSLAFLIKDLKLAGGLHKMAKLTSKLTSKLAAEKEGGRPVKLSDLANTVLAHTVLLSHLTDATYFYSQQKFRLKVDKRGKYVEFPSNLTPDPKYDVGTKGGSGYLASRSAKDWGSGGAISVEIGKTMSFCYAERHPGGDGEQAGKENAWLTRIRSIDVGTKSPADGFFKQLGRAMECMDTRDLLPSAEPRFGAIDAEETDTDRLAAICQPVLDAVVQTLQHLEDDKGVAITGKEPIFCFGTAVMRSRLRELEAKHGGRCFEVIEAAATFMTMKMPHLLSHRMPRRPRSDESPILRSHTIHFDVCSQEDVASHQNLAITLALTHGELEEGSEEKKRVIAKALNREHGCRVGNLAYGKSSMQGFPDGLQYLSAQFGLDQVTKFLQDEIVELQRDEAEDAMAGGGSGGGGTGPESEIYWATDAQPDKPVDDETDPKEELEPSAPDMAADGADSNAKKTTTAKEKKEKGEKEKEKKEKKHLYAKLSKGVATTAIDNVLRKTKDRLTRLAPRLPMRQSTDADTDTDPAATNMVWS